MLFHIRYAKQFGDGMIVKPNKTFVGFTYRPASSALDEITIAELDVQVAKSLPNGHLFLRHLPLVAIGHERDVPLIGGSRLGDVVHDLLEAGECFEDLS